MIKYTRDRWENVRLNCERPSKTQNMKVRGGRGKTKTRDNVSGLWYGVARKMTVPLFGIGDNILGERTLRTVILGGVMALGPAWGGDTE